MGKNKNRNRRKKKLLLLSVESKSSTSDGKSGNPEKQDLLDPEQLTSYRENMQGKRRDLLNEISKIYTFNETGSETLAHPPLPVTDSAKVKIGQTPENEIKSSFNKNHTQNTLSIATNRTGYREDIKNEWDDFFNGPSKANTSKNSGSQALKSNLLNRDRMKSKVDQTTANEALIKCAPSFNKAFCHNVASGSREDNSQTVAGKNKSVVGGDKMQPKMNQTTANEALIKCTPSFNKAFSRNVASSSREDNSQTVAGRNKPVIHGDKMQPKMNQTTANEALIKRAVRSEVETCNQRHTNEVFQKYNKQTEVSKFSNGNFSRCLEAPISNGTRSKVNRSMYPETSKFSTTTVSKDSTESLRESLSIYKKQYHNFQRIYSSWRRERQETLKKLEKLKTNVHNDQRMFNKTNAFFKDLNIGSRQVKMVNSSAIQTSFTSMSIDFLTSLSTIATDAASGITSIAQAFNIDNYMETFTKIMEHDKEITKPLYTVRSLCLKQYQNVEEVFRKYHSDSFVRTAANISNALNLEELWLDLNGKGKDETCTVIDCFDKYYRVNLNNEAMSKVYYAVQDYTEKNPAALDACVSAGKVCYDIYDTWSIKPNGSVSQIVSKLANKHLLIREMAELRELRSVADNEYKMQANLESDISDAIHSLQEEMTEIDDNFKKFHHSFKKKFDSF